MPRRPASVTESDITRVIRAAKKTGAHEVEIRLGEALIVVRLASSTGQETPLEQSEQITL
jgi:hypothetical protein